MISPKIFKINIKALSPGAFIIILSLSLFYSIASDTPAAATPPAVP